MAGQIRVYAVDARRVGGGPDPAAVSSDTVQASPIFRLITLTHVFTVPCVVALWFLSKFPKALNEYVAFDAVCRSA